MGNKKSTPKETKQDGKDAEPVKRRQHKHGKRKERPFSDPGTLVGSLVGEDKMSPALEQFYLKPKQSDRMVISGKGITGVNLEPNLLPAADYEEPSSSEMPTGAQIELYKEALEQVLKIWPEYYPVKEISVHDSSSAVVNTLQQIANRLCQQHAGIKKVSEEYHEVKQILDELQEERDSIKQILRKREAEANGLREDVGLLRGELKRRGHDVKLPHRTSVSTHEPNYDNEILTPRSDTSSVERDEDSTLHRRRNKEGIYAATPLLLAEGDRSRSFLAKRLSVRAGSDDHPPYPQESDRWPWAESNASDDLKERVKLLQAALDKERDKNKLLRGESTSPRSPRRSEYSQLSLDQLSQKYTSIQHEAFDKVRRQVINNLGHVEEIRQWRFISCLMEESFNVAKNTVEQFQDILLSLLMDPTRPQNASKRSSVIDSHRPRRTGSILQNVRKFEEKTDFMRNRMKKMPSKDIPDELIDYVYSFLEENSDVIEVSTLVENTIDSLRKEFSDCVTPALLNQSTFTNFCHSVCRLTWQLNVHSPPLYVTAEIKMFETRYHVTNSQHSTPGDEIKYYLWPILLSKRHGDVLCKGIVHL